jgi:protein ImuB
MSRRILCLFFPRFTIDRLEQEDERWIDRPLAIVREEARHLYVASVNAMAWKTGVRIGDRVADARAVQPDLRIVLEDPDGDERLQEKLVAWCDRYSPLVAVNGPDGIVLDITGCAHLFGGEAALCQQIETKVRSMRFQVRAAIADTLGAAWALARFSQKRIVVQEELEKALEDLPVSGLRILPETIGALERVGIQTIGQLQRIPRDSLAPRYGAELLLRLDQALGKVPEPVTPYRLPRPYRCGQTFAEPIGTTTAVEYVLLHLLTTLCTRLEKEHRGARQFTLLCFRVDNSVAVVEVRTSKPSRSITHLMRLFSEKMSSLDAGFGIETMVLQARDVDGVMPVQLFLPHCGDAIEADASFEELLDRLALRLGFSAVCRLQIHESFLPELSTSFVPVTNEVSANAAWPHYRLRPVRLYEKPVPIAVSEIFPDELPVRMRIGSQMHQIVRAEGPERLAPEWWRSQKDSFLWRDYYRIENEGGLRFWIFRETTESSLPRWFLHGQLA